MMKNKLFFLGTIVVMLGVVFVFSGCLTTTATEMYYSNQGIFGEAVIIPLKDFEGRGMVYKTFTFRIDKDGRITGDVFKYQDLLKLAEAKGADAIINITIDKRTDMVKTSDSVFSEEVLEETWWASALAIKYTGALTQGENPAVNRPRSWSFNNGASSVQESGGGGSLSNLFGK
jgi:hypothetical protein